VSESVELTPKRKPLSFDNESEYSLKEKAKRMDGNSSAGSTPKMDWSSGDLPSARKAFKQHCEFTFGGPVWWPMRAIAKSTIFFCFLVLFSFFCL